jgi:hypothetical protein
MDSIPGRPGSHHDRLADSEPAVEDHGRVVTAHWRAAAFYRRAQRATDALQAATALRLAIDADAAFGLAIADLDAITRTTGRAPDRQQMNWERHHIEVVRSAAAGNTERATGLLREHLASVGCDPLAVRIVARLRRLGERDDDFEDLARRLPGCHAARWPSSP